VTENGIDFLDEFKILLYDSHNLIRKAINVLCFHTAYAAYSRRIIKISLFFLSLLSFHLQGQLKEFDDTAYEIPATKCLTTVAALGNYILYLKRASNETIRVISNAD
jgi:CRISPR/Cas system-associated endonuclease/helicase Cas3